VLRSKSGLELGLGRGYGSYLGSSSSRLIEVDLILA
jgi:hypothetical protein